MRTAVFGLLMVTLLLCASEGHAQRGKGHKDKTGHGKEKGGGKPVSDGHAKGGPHNGGHPQQSKAANAPSHPPGNAGPLPGNGGGAGQTMHVPAPHVPAAHLAAPHLPGGVSIPHTVPKEIAVPIGVPTPVAVPMATPAPIRENAALKTLMDKEMKQQAKAEKNNPENDFGEIKPPVQLGALSSLLSGFSTFMPLLWVAGLIAVAVAVKKIFKALLG